MHPAFFFSVARHKLRTLRILPDVNKPSQMEKVFRVLEMESYEKFGRCPMRS